MPVRHGFAPFLSNFTRRNVTADLEEMVEVPKALFTHLLERQLAKHVRPPTRKHRGKKVRQSKPVFTTMEVWQEQLSMDKNLPAMVSVE